jgi:hypothetical protein
VPTVPAQEKASVPASIATSSQLKLQASKSQATPPTVKSKPTGPNGTMTFATKKKLRILNNMRKRLQG